MQNEIERELSILIGRVWHGTGRTLDMIALRFGEPDAALDGNGETPAATAALAIACAWRLTAGGRILVGSGDLFTPADPDGEPETFDWEPEGSSWLDVRLAELADALGANQPVVVAVAADPFGGVRVSFADGPVLGVEPVLELFPTSTPSGHVSTEFWRLSPPGGSGPGFVVGTFGVEREPSA